jgi:imidazolonepropionase-like amidohydrolase
VTRLVVRAPLVWLCPDRVLPGGEVVCEGGRIAAVAEAGTSGASDPVVEVDGFLMPGIADRHVHVGLADPGAILAGGVTAVRDLAWPAADIFPLAEASEVPTFTGPLIRAAGPMLTAPGGYPTRASWAPPGTGREVASAEEAVAAVRDLAARGASVIKVALNADAGPPLGDAALVAVCEEARSRGLPVTAHAQGAGQVDRALGAGVDELAHAPFSERLSDALIDALSRTMRIVSTLDIHGWGSDTPEIRTALDNLSRFHAAGGRVVYGTDLGNGPIPPGIHVREAMLLQDAGLTRHRVLAAMAIGPLLRGAPADLVAFGGDPTADLRSLDDLALVVRSGRVVAAA